MTEPTTLAGALLAAQQTMHGVGKTGRNQQQGWAFVTVEDVTRACRECLTAAGLVAVYRLTSDATADTTTLDGYLEVTHPGSGEQLRLPMPWPIERSGPQARRAAFSYARKQALVELLMVAEPDDPETAATPATPPAKRASKTKPAAGPQPMTDAQRRALWAVARKAGYGDPAELAVFVAGHLNLEDVSDELLGGLTKTEASSVIDALGAVRPAERVTADQVAHEPADPWSTAEPGAGQ